MHLKLNWTACCEAVSFSDTRAALDQWHRRGALSVSFARQRSGSHSPIAGSAVSKTPTVISVAR